MDHSSRLTFNTEVVWGYPGLMRLCHMRERVWNPLKPHGTAKGWVFSKIKHSWILDLGWGEIAYSTLPNLGMVKKINKSYKNEKYMI